LEEGEGFEAVVGGVDRAAAEAQLAGEDVLVYFVVFDDEDVEGLGVEVCGWWVGGWCAWGAGGCAKAFI
jgi:hypothetical protein